MKQILYALLAGILLISFTACGNHGEPSAKQEISISSAAPPVTNTDQTVSVVFPAYQEGKNEFNSGIFDTKPFTAAFCLPEGWEIRLPAVDNRAVGVDFFTTVDLYHDGKMMGYMGFNTFTPPEEEIPKEDYYKAVYPSLRLSSMCIWDPYTPVKTTATTENAVATVNYKDPEEIDKHPGAMVEVPFIEVPGVLAYDQDMLVFVGIRFQQNAVTEDQARRIAESIVLTPNS